MLGILDKAMFMAAGGGGPRLVSYADALSPGADTTLTITKPTGVVLGMQLVVFLASSIVGTNWSMPAGWTEDLDQSTPSLCVARKIATGSEPANYTFTKSGTAAPLVGQILAITNGVFDAIGAPATSSTTSLTLPGITSMGGLLFAIFSGRLGTPTFADPPSMSLVALTRNTTNVALYSFIQKVPPGATGTRTSSPISVSSGNGTGVLYGVKRA